MAGEAEQNSTPQRGVDSPPLIDLGVGIGFVVAGIVLFSGGQAFPVAVPNTAIGPGLMPMICGVVFMLGGAALAFRSVLSVRAGLRAPDAEDNEPGALVYGTVILVGMVFAFFAMPYLGFVVTTGLYAFAVTLAGRTSIWGAALSAAAITGATYVLFQQLMRVPLPTASLF